MSTSILLLGNAASPAETLEPACRLVAAVPAPDAAQARSGARPFRSIGRPDTLTAQRVEVGIVLQAMLGMSAASDYFAKHDVDMDVALRVLSPLGRRRGSHDANGIRL
jgi:hypothetical protein